MGRFGRRPCLMINTLINGVTAKVILITGASTGLGESRATFLARREHIVYGTSRQAGLSREPFKLLTMDVGDPTSVQ